jgi:hypothetical protein
MDMNFLYERMLLHNLLHRWSLRISGKYRVLGQGRVTSELQKKVGGPVTTGNEKEYHSMGKGSNSRVRV